MLIPAIDLKDGAVVQLVQGEKLAIRDDDIEKWVKRFERFPKVQLIDLDAAMGSGDNLAIICQIAPRLTCRVGGGIRTAARASEILAAGAKQVIAAVDSRGGKVVIHGWKTPLPVTAVEAVRALEPFCSEFLYTHVDAEGLMRGTDIPAILDVRHATTRRLTAAGGITTQHEIDELDAHGVDAVVGMAVYTGKLAVPEPPSR